MILVPVKNLDHAKQRLAAVLTQEQRTMLARTMLKDICAALAEVPGRPQVGIVTSDRFAVALARRYQFEVIKDDENRGETEAIAMATQEAARRGAKFTLVVPGDIPLLRPAEVDAVLKAAPEEGSVLVTAADGRGTNAALRRPCALFPLRFGYDSFAPHYTAALATLKPCVVLDNAELPGIALDIDRPADLAQLLAFEMRTRTQKLLCDWELPQRWRGKAHA
jgi:2-phospho-L-lactate/phosphoenolpyruvate guanylyltransferase